MGYNIVTNRSVMQDIRKCPYFRVNLGIVNTVQRSDTRIYNDADKFAFHYNNLYKTTIFGCGNIGDLMFYIDHYIKDEVLAIYYNTEEFIFKHDRALFMEKGINFYLGHLIKELETQHEERIKASEDKKIETKPEANPDILMKNPGAVSYQDLQAYIKAKNENRYSVKETPKKD